MNSKTLKKRAMNWKQGLTLCVLITAILTLTNCASVSLVDRTSLQIYQPSYLYLKKNQPVQTAKGKYTPQLNETWVSSAKYKELERENIALAEALRKLQAEKSLR